jgi:pimeloyl-ACP methyl ester carboxylesterase
MHHLSVARALSILAGTLLVVACGGAASTGPIGPAATSSATAASVASASGSPNASATELVADLDVGGRTLHLVCVGPTDTGEPTVLLEAGLGAPYGAWSDILVSMRDAHRVCAYDRAGLGMSEAAPTASRTAADAAADLRALLDAAALEGPFVIGAHSFGAQTMSVFAQTDPEALAGFVFVDPRGPRVSGSWLDALPVPAADEAAAIAANRDELTTFETDPSLNDEHFDLAATAAEAMAALDAEGPLFGDRPVVVLSAADTMDAWADLPPDLAATFGSIWLAGQQELADESTAGTLTVVPDSGHEIQAEQPAAVVAALESVLAAAGGQ